MAKGDYFGVQRVGFDAGSRYWPTDQVEQTKLECLHDLQALLREAPRADDWGDRWMAAHRDWQAAS